jgi:hypothetical protein
MRCLAVDPKDRYLHVLGTPEALQAWNETRGSTTSSFEIARQFLSPPTPAWPWVVGFAPILVFLAMFLPWP